MHMYCRFSVLGKVDFRFDVVLVLTIGLASQDFDEYYHGLVDRDRVSISHNIYLDPSCPRRRSDTMV